MSKQIEVILASTLQGEIGFNNTIPWKLKGDLKRFRDLTMGNIVIMGKNTYQSLPKKLDGRKVIVVSKSLFNATFRAPDEEDLYFASSLKDALIIAKTIDGNKIVVAGGVALYEAILNFPCIVHLTTVYKKSENGYDAKIDNFNLSNFILMQPVEVILDRNETTNLMEVSHTYSTYCSANDYFL